MLIDDCAKYLNATLVMNNECPACTVCCAVYTILFGACSWQPCPDKRDSRIISCPTWPAIERTIPQITQDEEVYQR